MKRYRVTVETWQYNGVYVYAESAEEAEKIVQEQIDNGTVKFDDDGDSGVWISEGCTDEIDKNGCLIM